MFNIQSQMGPFAIIPRWVRHRLAGNKWALVLYCVLADYVDRDTGEWKMSRKALADEMGCGLSTLRDAQTACIEAGCIVVEPTTTPDGDQGWNRYRVIQVAPPAEAGDSAAGGLSPEQQGSAVSAPTLPITPLNNPSQEPTAAQAPAEQGPTINQRAQIIQRGYFEWVKAQTGHHPALGAMAVIGVVRKLLERGRADADIKRALVALHNAGQSIAVQPLEAEMDGRRRRPPARRDTDADLAALRFDEHGNLVDQ